MKTKGYALAMANRGLVLLKYMFNLAIKWEIPGVKVNPAVGVKLYEANARERFLTAEETQRLLGGTGQEQKHQLKYIVPLLLLLGCRKRELLDSRWEDIDLERTKLADTDVQVRQGASCAFVPGSRRDIASTATMGRLSLCHSEPGHPVALCADSTCLG